MIVSLPNPKLKYEVENTLRLFLPAQKFDFVGAGVAIDGDFVSVSSENGLNRVALTLDGRGFVRQELTLTDFAAVERSVCRSLFLLLRQATGFSPKWGMLTGVRPVKLLRDAIAQGADEAALKARFIDGDFVSPEKLDLCRRIVGYQNELLAGNRSTDCSLYVSIPFCPTRCSYCTFVSHSVKEAARLIPAYLDRLCDELEYSGRSMAALGKGIKTVYIGGGTPTTLSAAQLDRLLKTIRASFDLSGCTEFTVEAGRPDTITAEKLKTFTDYGVTRISINPQSLNDKVIAAIGRNHTAQQFFDAYALAKEYPLLVNVDLIAGLPEDTADSFAASVAGVLALAPGNITVHSLTRKRGAALTEAHTLTADGELTAAMLETAHGALQTAGYLPYYLYRQKGTVGALENTGYARPGQACLYNVYIMEECHTILSAGAGASSKVAPASGRISRVFNYKYPYEYIERFDEILRRKEQFFRTLEAEKSNRR